MHPLDGISNWNKLYGKFGFIQYQFVVPDSEFLFLEEVLELLKSHRIASPLGVLKKLGGQSNSLLGFADRGWTLAIDIPRRTRNLDLVLEKLDAVVINRGGKVYLTKDSCLTKQGVRLMYPRLKDWQKIKSVMDPIGLWVSDQSRRLGL
jgi:decaprenylphospho-beta-D-ribofuranose 2-oxidase